MKCYSPCRRMPAQDQPSRDVLKSMRTHCNTQENDEISFQNVFVLKEKWNL